MSIHSSLRLRSGSGDADRSVFTRRERLERLLADGKLAAEASPLGLPKVRTKFKVLTKKQLKDAAKSAEGGEAAVEAPAAE
jgi:small basic protein (TIGR04137 family)